MKSGQGQVELLHKIEGRGLMVQPLQLEPLGGDEWMENKGNVLGVFYQLSSQDACAEKLI